jgi:plasmid stability protein
MRMIQIRNVPDRLHRKLKARAALAGMTLSDYLRVELERILERPTRAEVVERVAEREPIELEPSAAKLIREGRDER